MLGEGDALNLAGLLCPMLTQVSFFNSILVQHNILVVRVQIRPNETRLVFLKFSGQYIVVAGAGAKMYITLKK